MVAPDNPFLTIVPEEKDSLIDREQVLKDLEQKTIESLKGGTLIILSAGYGMGKSIVKDHFKEKIKKKVRIIELNFTNQIADDIRNLPSEDKRDILVVIERFDLIDVMDAENKRKVTDLIIERNNKGLTFLILCIPEVVNRLFNMNGEFEKRSQIITLSAMTFEEAREMVISRLNTARKKSDSLEPLTEHELKEIWKKSRGNPRMILLLCATLYDKKMVKPL